MILKINLQNKTALRVRGESLSNFGIDERTLQAIFFNSLDQLIPDDELIIIMQSRMGPEEPDLMAIDKDGSLYIFEIKKWESKQENLLQVLRYGQIFGPSSYQDLLRLYQKFHNTKRDLLMTFKEKFGREIKENDLNKRQIFVLIVNGIDYKTREAIRYWRKACLDVRPWIYRVYKAHDNSVLLELNPFRVEDNPYEDISEGFYILNTNRQEGPEDEAYMLENKRAAAFFDPWKRKIERLNKGDYVFLYGSGEGILAFGRVSGKVNKRSYHGDDRYLDEEYYRELSQFHKLKKPITASEIKEISGVNYIFMQTMFAIDSESGQKLLNRANSD